MKCPFHQVTLRESLYTSSSLICDKCKNEYENGLTSNDGIFHKDYFNKTQSKLTMNKNLQNISDYYKNAFDDLIRTNKCTIQLGYGKIDFISLIAKENKNLIFISRSKAISLYNKEKSNDLFDTTYIHQFLHNFDNFFQKYNFIIFDDLSPRILKKTEEITKNKKNIYHVNSI